MNAPMIRHRPECTNPAPYETTGRLGDSLTRCRSCGAFVVLPKASTPTRAIAPTVCRVLADAETVTPESRYRCGGHPDQRVTWKGTRCPECRAEHHARLRARATRRREVATRKATRTTH